MKNKTLLISALAILILAIFFMADTIKAPAGGVPQYGQKTAGERLLIATKEGQAEVAKLLLEQNNIDIDSLKKALWLAIHTGAFEIVKEILNSSAFEIEFADHGTIRAALDRANYLFNQGLHGGFNKMDESLAGPEEYRHIPKEDDLRAVIAELETAMKRLGISK